MKLIIKIVLLMMLPLSGFGVVKYSIIRPLEIQVVDAVTKQPLPNIVVYYKLKAVRMPHVLGIPLIDPIQDRNMRMERLVTDENGKGYISEYRAWLRLYEHPDTELFVVNSDIESENMTPEDRKKELFKRFEYLTFGGKVPTDFFTKRSVLEPIFNPEKQYKGAVLFSGLSNSNKEPLKMVVEGRIVVMLRYDPLQKEREIITFELERSDAK